MTLALAFASVELTKGANGEWSLAEMKIFMQA